MKKMLQSKNVEGLFFQGDGVERCGVTVQVMSEGERVRLSLSKRDGSCAFLVPLDELSDLWRSARKN